MRADRVVDAASIHKASGSALIEGAIVATTIALLLSALVRVPAERVRVRHAGATLHILAVTPWTVVVRRGADLLAASTGAVWTRVASPGPQETGVITWESGAARVEIERSVHRLRARWHDVSFRSGDIFEERSFLRITN